MVFIETAEAPMGSKVNASYYTSFLQSSPETVLCVFPLMLGHRSPNTAFVRMLFLTLHDFYVKLSNRTQGGDGLISERIVPKQHG